jgi:hypothetical protein
MTSPSHAHIAIVEEWSNQVLIDTILTLVDPITVGEYSALLERENLLLICDEQNKGKESEWLEQI